MRYRNETSDGSGRWALVAGTYSEEDYEVRDHNDCHNNVHARFRSNEQPYVKFESGSFTAPSASFDESTNTIKSENTGNPHYSFFGGAMTAAEKVINDLATVVGMRKDVDAEADGERDEIKVAEGDVLSQEPDIPDEDVEEGFKSGTSSLFARALLKEVEENPLHITSMVSEAPLESSNEPIAEDHVVTIGLMLSRNHAGIGHPETETRQTAFDFNELQDRQYEFVSSTNGWLAGGGEHGSEEREENQKKSSSCDITCLPIMSIHCKTPEQAQRVVSSLAAGAICIPPISLLPDSVSLKDGDLLLNFGCHQNDLLRPEEWSNWCLEFVHNQLYENFCHMGAIWSNRPFQFPLAQGVKFHSKEHMDRYFLKAQCTLDKWKEDGPRLLNPVPDGGSVPSGEFAHPNGIYLLQNSQPTHYFTPNFEPPYTAQSTRTLISTVMDKSWDRWRSEWLSVPEPKHGPHGVVLSFCGCEQDEDVGNDFFVHEESDQWRGQSLLTKLETAEEDAETSNNVTTSAHDDVEKVGVNDEMPIRGIIGDDNGNESNAAPMPSQGQMQTNESWEEVDDGDDISLPDQPGGMLSCVELTSGGFRLELESRLKVFSEHDIQEKMQSCLAQTKERSFGSCIPEGKDDVIGDNSWKGSKDLSEKAARALESCVEQVKAVSFFLDKSQADRALQLLDLDGKDLNLYVVVKVPDGLQDDAAKGEIAYQICAQEGDCEFETVLVKELGGDGAQKKGMEERFEDEGTEDASFVKRFQTIFNQSWALARTTRPGDGSAEKENNVEGTENKVADPCEGKEEETTVKCDVAVGQSTEKLEQCAPEESTAPRVMSRGIRGKSDMSNIWRGSMYDDGVDEVDAWLTSLKAQGNKGNPMDQNISNTPISLSINSSSKVKEECSGSKVNQQEEISTNAVSSMASPTSPRQDGQTTLLKPSSRLPLVPLTFSYVKHLKGVGDGSTITIDDSRLSSLVQLVINTQKYSKGNISKGSAGATSNIPAPQMCKNL